ncbi:aminotransferase class V-fold PLP-dependent enzyme [Chromatocurvus halotolerans]|uniref:Cysteine desulfurase/selenocysteine lyase n=1 Tax=Chromatocurvus halotolerans TaxID=1132028 RepID=A0A4R2LCE7_9GAMM|nr:aminotransferase class V-fold PLP-dependent enzyme [Chromatocurvus halotolerans]TCO76995.1 cysteine desulfurase/selenocysteine lyase [Chromatocurvus halotolerans]
MDKHTIAGTTRRTFLMGLPVAGLMGTSLAATALDRRNLTPLPQLTDQLLWRAVREEFRGSLNITAMNAANMSPPCAGARAALEAATTDIDRDPSFENRAKYQQRHEATRAALAELIGAALDEIAITRNTSEGNNLIVQGLALGPGDEIVLWEENHRSNELSWEVRAQREGFKIIRVATPKQPESAEDLIAPFREAIGPSTRLVSFSHVSNSSGTELPAAALCKLTADAGALSMIDGAQTVGAMALDVKALGCDFMTCSGQKWMCGPREAGMLYVRKDRQELLNPLIVSYPLAGGDTGARAFEMLGQRDDGAIDALGQAAALHLAIGPSRVEARVRSLTDLLMAEIRHKAPSARFLTPENPAYRLGVVVTAVTHGESGAAQARAYEQFAVSGSAFPGALRLCPHIYNDEADIERAAAAMATAIAPA